MYLNALFSSIQFEFVHNHENVHRVWIQRLVVSPRPPSLAAANIVSDHHRAGKSPHPAVIGENIAKPYHLYSNYNCMVATFYRYALPLNSEC
jgi:hypothetical protein